jgi:hypothetical protein
MTKSFGKRDFMQPKGRVNMHSGGGGDLIVFLPGLISAPAISPGEKQFWKNEKYMRAMGRVNHALQVARFFVSFEFGGGRKDFFSSFFLIRRCSFYVIFKFPMGSH